MEKAKVKELVAKMIDDGILPLDVVVEIINIYDSIIHVDRSVSPTYPDWAEKPIYPEFELVGLSDFNVIELEQHLHPKQMNGYATGNEIHDELVVRKMIEDCLGLTDLLVIQARGIGFFRKHYSGKAVFGWRSVVQSRDGILRVPFLVERDDGVILRWNWLDDAFNSSFPALRFRK